MSVFVTPRCLPMNDFLTPTFTTCVDSFTPLMPSILQPIGATLIIPSPGSLYPLPSNYDLNRDERVHKQVVKYFRYKILDKWLYDEMKELLNFLVVDNTGVHLIKDMSEYKVREDSEENIERKIEYIEKYFLTKDTVNRLLRKFVKGTNTNWYDLHKNQKFVMEDLKNQLKRILRQTVEEYKKI